MLIRGVRLVPVSASAPDGLVDVRVSRGVVTAVKPGLVPDADENVLDAEGRWLLPGLWDAHVHMQQWARALWQHDLSGTTSPADVVQCVGDAARHLDGAGRPDALVAGRGYRSGTWSRPPTVAELDEVSGQHPVALISADVHNGWLNTAALAALGLPPRLGPIEEAEWFAVMARLGELGQETDAETSLRTACQQAAAAGVVGITDMEMEPGYRTWPPRVARGADLLRVRTATYLDHLDDVLTAGLRSGDELDPAGLVVMGPLKVIFDGSVNTRTAYCCAAYDRVPESDGWRGVLNHEPEVLVETFARASAAGLDIALHAIGDAAVTLALDIFERVGAKGSVEHAQLVGPSDLPRFAQLGVRASMQPAHLLDDRDISATLWPDSQDRCFALRSLLEAGADLRLGSDAPVARLDPWLAMAAAVHRTADDRPPWMPQEAITPRQALAASTDGQGTVAVGSPGDLVLLDDDPLAPATDTAEAAVRLRAVRVHATLVAGRLTHGGLAVS